MEKNAFDAIAQNYDEDPGHQKRAEAIFAAMTRMIPLTKNQEILECGAGTGLLTVLLAPHVASILATDVSLGMLTVLEEKCHRLGLDNVHTALYDPASEDLDRAFDGIVGAMILHHIPQTQTALKRFHGLLRPTGWVALADLDAEDGSFHSAGMPQPAHHGFDRAKLLLDLESAGFHSVHIDTVHSIEKNGKVYPIFLATGQKT